MDLVLHHFHYKCIMKRSSNGQYEQEESLQQEKKVSMFFWAADWCFNTVLSDCLNCLDYCFKKLPAVLIFHH